MQKTKKFLNSKIVSAFIYLGKTWLYKKIIKYIYQASDDFNICYERSNLWKKEVNDSIEIFYYNSYSVN